MKSLQQYLEEECDTYFTKIKKGPVKVNQLFIF